MKKGSKLFLNIIITLSWCVAAAPSSAQVYRQDSLVVKGDSLRRAYRFEESAKVYSEAMAAICDTSLTEEDSLLRLCLSDRLLLAENGKNMTEFVYRPSVVSKHRFSLADFFLYYPLKDRSWRSAPNQLDTISSPYARAIYAPAEADVIYYSAEDKEGIRNIYRTAYTDSLWTLPSLINEQLTSFSDDIYPLLSSDGKSLYFSSKGLHGVGGYDLYVSRWDERAQDWSEPENMGFPYSSPDDDFLYMDTEDGKYSLFASNRDCPEDSVYVYVLEADNMPVRSMISDCIELVRIAALEPERSDDTAESGSEVKSDIPENVDTRRYMDQIAAVRALRDTIATCEGALAGYRERYAMADDDKEKSALAEKILEGESLIPEYQSRLDAAVRLLQDIEMDFLFSGVVIDPDRLLVEAEREIVAETAGYAFTKMTMGEPLTLEMEQPQPEFDYSFRILDTALFVPGATIPEEGITYQIQLFATRQPAAAKALKGISPVFEMRAENGHYVYRVGLFREYKDVLAHLNTVKRLGFRNAYIVGYIDGKEEQVNLVRGTENERKQHTK